MGIIYQSRVEERFNGLVEPGARAKTLTPGPLRSPIVTHSGPAEAEHHGRARPALLSQCGHPRHPRRVEYVKRTG